MSSSPAARAEGAARLAELRAWFLLLETPGLGRSGQRRLLAAFGAPEAVLRAPLSALKNVVPAPQAQAVQETGLEPSRQVLERWQRCERWLSEFPRQRHLITLGDPAYPALLLQTADPPLALYVEGDLECLSRPSLAVVGSRHASAQGLDTARALALEVAQRGFVIVSGLARGIDAAAHEGALATQAQGGAGTVAVLGGGLDDIYPPAHRGLAQRIAEAGALVSEYSPGTPPRAPNFPQRNRIIAGLSQGTLVVEAALRSGSLITARLAAEAGREVFAVPGSIHALQSKGCHTLIRQGAKLVEVAADILEEFDAGKATARPAPRPAPRQEFAEPASSPNAASRIEPEHEDSLLAAMGYDPVTLDALQARTGASTAELMARLMELEFEHRVARLPGGLYQRRGLG